MSGVFGSVYSDIYDLFYHDKDYAAECDLIEHALKSYSESPVHSILDLGCGTGNHAIPLAQRGYQVSGVDFSEEMLARAKAKADDMLASGEISFAQGDIRNIDLGRKFDAALMMFAVLGYQYNNADVLSALETARKHLRKNGLLVFDVWYGPAVLQERPSQRAKVIPTPEGKILRVASGDLDVNHHACQVNYHVWQLNGKSLVAETEESHSMRYFFPLELELFLDQAGFTLVRLGAFPSFEQDPDETTWNVLAIARAV